VHAGIGAAKYLKELSGEVSEFILLAYPATNNREVSYGTVWNITEVIVSSSCSILVHIASRRFDPAET
jgi:hypothetical protein